MRVTRNIAPFIDEQIQRSKLISEDSIQQRPISVSSRRYAQGDATSAKSEMSILACDIIGSTDMAQSSSPEELQKFVYAYHDYCTWLIHAQSGSVARYMGDDCLAFFETEEFSVCHALSSLFAAASILENKHVLERKLGHSIGLRIGVATGIVIRDESRTEQTIVGEPLHLANRLQLIAKENSIAVCPTTWSKTNTQFDFKALGHQKLKGYAELIQIWLHRSNG